MELYAELLSKILAQETVQVVFPNLELSAQEMVEQKCYQAIKEIKAIIGNENLADAECFRQIEEVVCVLETLGTGCGGRHDF